MFKKKSNPVEPSCKSLSIEKPQKTRIAFIEFNDGRRITLSRSQDQNEQLFKRVYGMTQESASRIAEDIAKVFLSGSL